MLDPDPQLCLCLKVACQKGDMIIMFYILRTLFVGPHLLTAKICVNGSSVFMSYFFYIAGDFFEVDIRIFIPGTDKYLYF